ncbi:hypothetical protein [Achromobacter pulmonis]|uniref:hypothetical protein n=1 Tax=Achromobacter pulmonis TaxID=1389932 RepID=UPI00215A080C|nr:hypothetical protein [Achromobacter pulmonis]
MNNEWKTIDSAPKTGRTLLLGYWNSHGNWRTVRGRWMSLEYIAEHWEDPDEAEEGWFETAVEADDAPNCWSVSPSHWQPMPVPPCPTCNDQGAVGNILTAAPCPECTPPASAQDDAKDERQADACPRCDGSGEITVMSDNSPDAHDVIFCCDHCQGSRAATDAAKYLAAALSGEKYRHMQLWGEYRNFHRSLCARFGYGHDQVHFRRDLVSLEEAIAAKVSAPAAGDAETKS